MAINKGLIGGSTPLLLLSLLESQDCYGYEIIKILEERSDNTFSFKEGTLYPVLHKLENEGYIRSYYKESDGRKRRYYTITKKGVKQLAEEKAQWERFSFAVNKVIGGEVNAIA
ncbi:MAG: PadR family transcriptional regulator [Clostridiales bacterium]|jgi:PadR family transcriptional regulator PadR|nr:PadR family transcriptional regulator [Clostridiales bacterium]